MSFASDRQTDTRQRMPSKHSLAPALALPLKVTQPESRFPGFWRKTHHVSIRTSLALQSVPF